MSSRFDQPIAREGSGALKYDGRQQTFGTTEVMPMWVADMDFAVPAAVTEALQARIAHPVFGYSLAPDSLYQALMDWLQIKHGWQVQREWIVLTPGVVPSLNLVVAALTAPNDGVIVQPPVYFPFFSAVTGQQRRLLENPLRLTSDHANQPQYQMDMDHLTACAQQARMLLLCSPHNPVGRVWQTAEMEAILSIANQHDLVVLSDEIHADLVYAEAQHQPLSRLAMQAETTEQTALSHRVITAVSPSKTFNIPGLGLSALIVPNTAHRQAIQRQLNTLGLSVTNPLNMAAFEAAYRGGSNWLNELMPYLQATRDAAVAYIQAELPSIKVIVPQATYLLWLDCRALNLHNAALKRFFIEEAQLGLSPGAMFGHGGEGFMRMNIGTPQANVLAALARLKAAFSRHGLST
ncbi:PatB family C-S lyase [Methylophilus sp. 13]|uniref:MalY/PatB family protein n=1 Tax=Methylophilus sp. 13 TaxID=2781018 RepID=UPI00188EC789|nr:PatB family C-S lyase [Methylophilus sp. 13]MBF5039870.1 PatB family C-S lyase [Methylophilus sp. 13]